MAAEASNHVTQDENGENFIPGHNTFEEIESLKWFFHIEKSDANQFCNQNLRYLIRTSNPSTPPVGCKCFTISFLYEKTKIRINHIRIYVRAQPHGICEDQSFEESKTFKTISEFLIHHVKKISGQDWGNELKPLNH